MMVHFHQIAPLALILMSSGTTKLLVRAILNLLLPDTCAPGVARRIVKMQLGGD